MSLEAALAENTATMKELIAALLSVGAVQTAQVSSAAHSSPAVKAVVEAQKKADAKDTAAKKQQTQETPAAAEPAPAASGEPSNSTGESSSDAPKSLHDWHEKTAELHAQLKDAEPNLENLRKAVLGINREIGRPQADAVLQRFGAQMITPKPNDARPSLDASQYPEVFKLCMRVLSGEVDATLSIPADAE